MHGCKYITDTHKLPNQKIGIYVFFILNTQVKATLSFIYMYKLGQGTTSLLFDQLSYCRKLLKTLSPMQ